MHKLCTVVSDVYHLTQIYLHPFIKIWLLAVFKASSNVLDYENLKTNHSAEKEKENDKRLSSYTLQL